MTARHRTLSALLAAALVVSGVFGLAGCTKSAQSDSTVTESDQTKDLSRPTLEEYLAADTKTGDFEQTTDFADGSTLTQTGKLWLDGDLFRYDLYQDGDLIRSIMTPDGMNVYFAQHPDGVCEPAVANAEHYLRQFNAPPVESVEDGIDEETGAQRIRYVIQETVNRSGAANPWYAEDIVYLVDAGAVVGIITRGAVPDEDGSIPDLQTRRRVFSDLQAGVEVDASMFELPYPIQDAD